MKTIGLVDYFIDEWHSNNYIPWINEICKEHGLEFEVKYAWAESETFEGKLSTDEWCKSTGVEKCASIDELCEKSDYIMILAPANPEKHLLYAKDVLKHGKNTYIDKTFAPDIKEAKEIYGLVEKYGTKFFSTSALRYAKELDAHANGVNSVIIKGGGRSFEEYIIHQIEMLVRLMGTGAKKVKVLSSGKQKVCAIEFEDERLGFLEYDPSNIFGFTVEDKDGTTKNEGTDSAYFKNLLKSILEFFQSGKVPFEKEQTLAVIAIRDALMKAVSKPDKWIKIKF